MGEFTTRLIQNGRETNRFAISIWLHATNRDKSNSRPICLSLLPKDRAKANGAILHDVNNRGNKLALAFFNTAGGNRNDPQNEADAGNGFLMRHGFTIASNGWDSELRPGGHRMQLRAPVAKHGSNLITGRVRCEIVPTRPVTRIDVNWANHGSYRPTEQGLLDATLTVRERAADERESIERERWKLHVTDVRI